MNLENKSASTLRNICHAYSIPISNDEYNIPKLKDKIIENMCAAAASIPEVITLKFTDQNSKEYHYMIKKWTPFAKLVHTHKQRNELDHIRFDFEYDDEIIEHLLLEGKLKLNEYNFINH